MTITREISSEAMVLLDWLKKENQQVADFLMRAYNGEEVNPVMLEETISFFTSNSAITAVVLASPGSSIISEILYDYRSTTSTIDTYFHESKGGRAVKGRLMAMQKNLPPIIESYLQKKGEVTIGSLGSGPGRYMIDAILQFKARGYNENVKAICFDSDENAIRRGKWNAKIYGVSDNIKFKRSDMFGSIVGYYKNRFDVIVLKGILCPYDSRGCRTLLEHIKEMLAPGGTVVASNVSKKMVEDDPFTCFIMNKIVNWVMNYKDEEELRGIFEASGYKWKGSFTDDLGFHIMGIAVVSQLD